MAKKPIPLIGYFGNEQLIARFMKHVRKTNGCWEWTASSMRNVNGDRRACFRMGPCWSASRAAHALLKGDVGDGWLVLHSCDNGMCVNPEHLRLGTNEENTADMMRRGRGTLGTKRDPATVKRGYKRPFMNRVRKLTDDDVRAIRKDERRAREIAADYGVGENCVFNIKARRRKAHVPD